VAGTTVGVVVALCNLYLTHAVEEYVRVGLHTASFNYQERSMRAATSGPFTFSTQNVLLFFCWAKMTHRWTKETFCYSVHFKLYIVVLHF
jgi:hypothetical protein